jgi:hypothetical protein
MKTLHGKPPKPNKGHALQDDASKEGSDEVAAVARSGQGKNLGFHPENTRP